MLDLDIFSHSFKLFERGICQKFVFHAGKEDYFFKKNYASLNQKEVPAHIVEVLCSRILKEVGCTNYVKYDIARYCKSWGCVSKSYRNLETEKEIDLVDMMVKNRFDVAKEKMGLFHIDKELSLVIQDQIHNEINIGDQAYLFSIENIIEQIETYCNNYDYTFDKEKLFFHFMEMAISDYFFLNSDRNWRNISLILNEKDEIRLVPIFDNGMSFALKTYPNVPRAEEIYLGISDIGTKLEFREHGILKENGLIVADILQLTENNKSLKQYVNKFLSLDIEQFIENFKLQENIDIKEDLEKRIIDLFTQRQQHFNMVKNKIEKRIKNSTNEQNVDLESV